MPTRTFQKLDSVKKQKIIDSAIDHFAGNGYTGTSMESVAESAGIAKGALYRYFTGKKDLFMTVVDLLVKDLEQYADQFIESKRESNVFQTIRDHMVSFYQLYEQFSMHFKVLCNVLYQEQIDFKGEVLAKFGKLTTHYTRLILQHGIARGEIQDDIDLEAAAFIVDCVMDRFHDGILIPYMDHGYGLFQQPQAVIERKADLIVESFRRAFGKSLEVSG